MPAAHLHRHAVFGLPVAHSRSPFIHAMFGRQCGVELVYERIEAAPEAFARVLEDFHAQGGRGANVTLPLKELAIDLCGGLSPAARRAGAVNTLCWRQDRWFGDNTDGAGLVRDIEVNLGWPLRGRRVLVLGAGGAARGVVPALFEAGIAELALANRTPGRARHLADDLAAAGPIRVLALEALPNAGRFDLILNATSAGRGGPALALPPSLPAAGALCYDLSYGAAAQPFLDWAKKSSGTIFDVAPQMALRVPAMEDGPKKTPAAGISDGLGMLVEQAALAFALWHGRVPQTPPVLAALRSELAQR